MYLIKYLEEPDEAYFEKSKDELVRYIINNKDSVLLTLNQFQDRFNRGDISEAGLIAIIPPLSYKKK